MTIEKFTVENTGHKLSKQLMSMIVSSGNNYQDTHIEVSVFEDSIEVSTFCVNEYGSRWDNENYTVVEKSEIPFFTAKKLGMI